MRRIGRTTLVVLGGALLLSGCGSSVSDPTGSERFQIPTYEWDRGSGMDALIEGRLAFTADGCTLLVPAEDDRLPEPVLFPNASGLRFSNGVRAVIESDTGKVYAVEGQQFSYGGGGVSAGESWTSQCGAYEPDAVNLINDLPAQPVPTADPAPHTGSLPTQIPTEEERGWYAVPTFEWDPAEGGDGALLTGTVTMTTDGCATVSSNDGVVGLILPNARGARGSNWVADGTSVIYSWFPGGGYGAMAEDGTEVSFGGGFSDLTGEFGDQWQTLCPDSPVDELFLVQDSPFS